MQPFGLNDDKRVEYGGTLVRKSIGWATIRALLRVGHNPSPPSTVRLKFYIENYFWAQNCRLKEMCDIIGSCGTIVPPYSTLPTVTIHSHLLIQYTICLSVLRW
jgi:hypothetical protein